MKINPVSFNGKVHITTVKNEQWSWADYKTSKKADKEIVKFVKEIVPRKDWTSREFIPEEYGKKIQDMIEKDVHAKLDVPGNCVYTLKRYEHTNPRTLKTKHNILLFCTAPFNENKDKSAINTDRTAIDIMI